MLKIVAGELGFKEVMRSFADGVPYDLERSMTKPEAKVPSKKIVVPGANPFVEPYVLTYNHNFDV